MLNSFCIGLLVTCGILTAVCNGGPQRLNTANNLRRYQQLPQPETQEADAGQRSKRQAFLPYFPYYSYVPPVYQVHNIILTPPGYHCQPIGGAGFQPPTMGGRYPDRPRPTPPPLPPTAGPDTDSLFNRMGADDNSTSAQQQPSKCVWSIVACCSPGSRDIRYACFELLGCPGAFWDVNPCDERVVTAAANAALRYYMNNQSPTPEPTFQNL